MRKRLSFWLVVALCSASLVLSAWELAGDRPSLVLLGPGGATVWRYDDVRRDYLAVWQSRPVFVEDASAASIARDDFKIQWPSTNPPVIADFNGDGVNELVVVDPYGIAIYGTAPSYLPFPEVSDLWVPIVVSDLDGDGLSEIITDRQFVGSGGRRIEIWKPRGAGLSRLWAGESGIDANWTLLLGDPDNDGRQELITAGSRVVIWRPSAPYAWEVAAELVNIASVVDVVRVADVDGDGKNEILATGNSGMLTVYRNRPRFRVNVGAYPVMWQSGFLKHEDLQALSNSALPLCLTQGLGVADLNGDNKLEILVGTSESGTLSNGTRKTSEGHVHVFSFDGDRGFVKTWTSDWTVGANIPAFSIGDLDGDGLNEFVYTGNDIYGYSKAENQYRLEKKLPPPVGVKTSQTAIGILPSLKEPVDAVRIVPVRWTLSRGATRLGESTPVSISLRSVWATAKDVVMEVASDTPTLLVRNGTVRIGEIPGGQTVTSPTFTLESPNRTAPSQADKDAAEFETGKLRVTITAAGGYRQTIPLRVQITQK